MTRHEDGSDDDVLGALIDRAVAGDATATETIGLLLEAHASPPRYVDDVDPLDGLLPGWRAPTTAECHTAVQLLVRRYAEVPTDLRVSVLWAIGKSCRPEALDHLVAVFEETVAIAERQAEAYHALIGIDNIGGPVADTAFALAQRTGSGQVRELALRRAPLDESDRLRSVERRLDVLERGQARDGVELQAPVRIVNDRGDLIAEVTYDERRKGVFRLAGPKGEAAVELGVDGLGGSVTVFNHEGHWVTKVDVESWGGRVRVTNPSSEVGVILFGGDSGEDAGGLLKVVTTSKFEDQCGPGFALSHDEGLQPDG